MIREGVVAVLKQFDSAAVVLQASNADSAMSQVKSTPALDCVLLDLNMPGVSGVDTLAHMRDLAPTLPILVFSSSEEQGDVRRAFAAGASGYCPKSSGNDTLLAALRMVMDGHRYIPPLMLMAPSAASGMAALLTDRQTQVLGLMAQGHPNKLIASQLDMQEKTVKGHVSAIFRALGVVNRVQAVEAARRAELLQHPPA